MNTVRKGRKYEVAYRELLRKQAYHVTRAAASKGPFDLIAYNPAATYFCALSMRRVSCAYARAAAIALQELLSVGTARYVHITAQRVYCEHDA